jgi:hypothetical protein
MLRSLKAKNPDLRPVDYRATKQPEHLELQGYALFLTLGGGGAGHAVAEEMIQARQI